MLPIINEDFQPRKETRRAADKSVSELIRELGEKNRERISRVFLGGLIAGIIGGVFLAPWLAEAKELLWK